MKNKAVAATLMSFLFAVSAFLLYSAQEFYLAGQQRWQKALIAADSLKKAATTKEGIVAQVSFVSDDTQQAKAMWGTPVLLAIQLAHCDTVFLLKGAAIRQMPHVKANARLQYIYHSRNKRAEVITWWLNGREVYSATEYLGIEPPEYGIIAFMVIFGLAIAAIGIYVFVFVYRFITGWIALRDAISLKRLPTKKMSAFQLTLLQHYLKKWDENFIIYIFTGVIMLIIGFLVPTRFLGLREMLDHATRGGSDETIASSIGYEYACLVSAYVILLFLAEYILGRKALQQDLQQGNRITMKGKIKGVFRDKKDGNQLKAVIVIGKMEFEEQEISEQPRFKKDDEVNIDLGLESLQIISISHADSSRSDLSVR